MFQKLIKFATEIMQGQRTEVAVPTTEEQTKGEVSVPTEDVDDGTPRYPPFKRGLPASTPAQIIKSQGDLIWRIKMVTGLSEGEFDRYVMPVIINYAKFVHLLPASEKHHHRGSTHTIPDECKVNALPEGRIKKVASLSQAGKGEDGFTKVNQDSFLVLQNQYNFKDFNIFSVRLRNITLTDILLNGGPAIPKSTRI